MLLPTWVERSRGCDAYVHHSPACAAFDMQAASWLHGAAKKLCSSALGSRAARQLSVSDALAGGAGVATLLPVDLVMVNENAVVAQSENPRRKQIPQIPQIHPRLAGPREMAWLGRWPACLRCSPHAAWRMSWGGLECCRLVNMFPKALQDGIITSTGSAHEY